MVAHPEASPRRHRASLRTRTTAQFSGRPRQLGWLALILLLTVWLYVAPDGASPSVIWPVLILFYILFARSLRRPVEIKAGIRSYATLEILFMVFYYVLFFWPYQMAVLGQLNLYNSKFVAATFVDESNRAIIFASLALVSFLAGIDTRRKEELLEAPMLEAGGSPRDRDYRGLAPVLLVLQAGLIAIYIGLGLRSQGEGRYSGTQSGGVVADGISLLVLMTCLVSIAMYIAFSSTGVRLPVSLPVCLALSACWALRVLLLGDRNSFLLIAVIATAGIFTFRIEGGRLPLLLLVVASLFLYNAVEVARDSREVTISTLFSSLTTDSGQGSSLARDRGDSSFNITTIGLRASIFAVPDTYPYGYGKYKLIGFAGVLPFARGLTLGSETGFTDTSEVLTAVMLPPNPGWNVGTNMISDSYVDFGIPGVVVLPFLVGRFAAFTRRRLRSGTGEYTPSVVFYLLTLALLTELPRYAIDFPVRILTWTALLLGAYRLLFIRERPSLAQKDI
jgi:O-antigen polysaccharide polymerase Wzy